MQNLDLITIINQHISTTTQYKCKKKLINIKKTTLLAVDEYGNNFITLHHKLSPMSFS